MSLITVALTRSSLVKGLLIIPFSSCCFLGHPALPTEMVVELWVRVCNQ